MFTHTCSQTYIQTHYDLHKHILTKIHTLKDKLNTQKQHSDREIGKELKKHTQTHKHIKRYIQSIKYKITQRYTCIKENKLFHTHKQTMLHKHTYRHNDMHSNKKNL